MDRPGKDSTGELAPIALFIYNRPHHLRRTIESLEDCSEFRSSPVFVFADGAKGINDTAAVREARSVARKMLGDHAIYVEQAKNIGLANSVISGVTDLCERFGRAIVVEDDLVVSPIFLQFLNEGLDRYQNDQRVMQVSGHMYDVEILRDRPEALFLPMTTSWGWATWKRAWDHFSADTSLWQDRLRDQEWRRSFDLNGSYPFSQMLRNQMAGRLDSWAIRWYCTVFEVDGLVLYPPHTLVANHGMDGSGTHGRGKMLTHQQPVGIGAEFHFPESVEEDMYAPDVYGAISRFKSESKPDVLRSIVTLTNNWLSRLRKART